jgi:hypothetical protein
MNASPRVPQVILEHSSLETIVGMDVDSKENMAIAFQTSSAPTLKVIMMYDLAGNVIWSKESTAGPGVSEDCLMFQFNSDESMLVSLW